MHTWIYTYNKILNTEEISPSDRNMVMIIQLPVIRSEKAIEGRRLMFLNIKYESSLMGMSTAPRRN